MRKAAIAAFMLAGLSTTALAIEPSVEDGEQVESRLNADLNGDGTADLAYIVAGGGWRELRVAIAGHREVEALDLSPDELVPGELTLDGNVLEFADVTGGTTAYATTRRYRYDGIRNRMRLIGLDVKLYSRTFTHDGFETSWNLLTGEGKANDLRLANRADGNPAYTKARQVSFRRRVRPVWLPNTPDPQTFLEENRDV